MDSLCSVDDDFVVAFVAARKCMPYFEGILSLREEVLENEVLEDLLQNIDISAAAAAVVAVCDKCCRVDCLESIYSEFDAVFVVAVAIAAAASLTVAFDL